MKHRLMIAGTLILAGCAMVQSPLQRGTLMLKPQVTAGGYGTRTLVPNYTLASIDHLILKLYTYDGSEHDQGIEKSIPNVQLGNAVTFSNLRSGTTYRIKALAYADASGSLLISTSDASSSTDIVVGTDDRPTVGTLRVQLIDRNFNGQATASGVVVTSGGYSPCDPEQMAFWGAAGVVSTFAGGGGATGSGYVDDVGTSALFYGPRLFALDVAGNLFVPDRMNNLIRKITSAGVVSTFAGGLGTTTAGYANGTGTSALFSSPCGVAVDGAGNVYVTETSNNLVRKITPAGVVSTLAGGGGGTSSGYADGEGTAALFSSPYGIAVDGSGNVYVAEIVNNLIRKITPAGLVSTLAGGGGGTVHGYADGMGTSALFYSPHGIVVDGAGNLYIGERSNHLVRKITPAGEVSTLAGGGGGTTPGYANGIGTAARFRDPTGIAIDRMGMLYVGDDSNHLIRKIGPTGWVSTLAGGAGGTASGYLDGTGAEAKFNRPVGVGVDSAGNVYVAEINNNLIRVIR